MSTINETTVATFNVDACIQVHRLIGETDLQIKTLVSNIFAKFKDQDFICLVDAMPIDAHLVDDRGLNENFDSIRSNGISIYVRKLRFKLNRIAYDEISAKGLSIFAIEEATNRCYSVGILIQKVQHFNLATSFAQLKSKLPLLVSDAEVKEHQMKRGKENPPPKLLEDAWWCGIGSTKLANPLDFEKYCQATYDSVPPCYAQDPEQALVRNIGTHIITSAFGRGLFTQLIYPYSSLFECHVVHLEPISGEYMKGNFKKIGWSGVVERSLSGQEFPPQGIVDGDNPMKKVWNLLETAGV